MNIYPLQTNFTTGILSPRLWCRSDTIEYRQGVKDCENMVTTRHGPIQSRNGTALKEDLGDFYARPFGFQLIPNSVTGEAFTATASEDGTLKLSGATGALFDDELVNGEFSTSLDNWNKIFVNGESSVSWSSGAAILTPQNTQFGSPAGVSQLVNVEVGEENDDRTIGFSSVLIDSPLEITTSIYIGTIEGGLDLAFKEFYGDNGELVFNPGGLTQFWVTIICDNRSPSSLPPGTPTNEYGYKKLLSVYSYLTSLVPVEFAHPWSASDIQSLHSEMSPNENSMYFVCQNVAPHKLNYDIDTNVWSFAEVVFVGTPTSWVAGNFPTTMGFFQGRSWWAGVESKPQTFWGSKPNDDSTAFNELEDLTTGTTAADALEFTLSRSGRIQWIEGARNLVIGTTAGEFLVNGSSGIIQPDDIFVSQQSADGGASVNAKKVGNMVLFVSGDGRKLLATRYYEDQNQWRSQELSFTAEDITRGKKIIEIAYAKNPESIIWCLLDDGTLIGCTYDPFNNSMGWHRHTLGNVLGISAVEKAGFSILSATVQRVINSQTVTYLEEFNLDYMDSSTVIETDSLDISVPHLAGEVVVVKIDDAQHPDVQLDENGDGTLDYFNNVAIVGLPMTAMVETLEPDLGSQAGTSMGFNKRFNEITARIYDSAYPSINGDTPPVRSPATLQGYREPNKTTDVTVTSIGYNDGSVTIKQTLPYKLTLTGLFGKMSQNKL